MALQLTHPARVAPLLCRGTYRRQRPQQSGGRTPTLHWGSACSLPWSPATCCHTSATGGQSNCLAQLCLLVSADTMLRRLRMAPQWHLKGATKPLLTQSCCSVACRRWLRPRTCRSQGFTFESYACAEQLPSDRHTPSSTPGQSLGEGPVRASTPCFAASQCTHMAGISHSVVGWHDAGSALLAVSEAPSPTTSAATSAGDVSGSPLRRRAGFKGSSTATSPLQPCGGASLQPQQALIFCSGWLATKPCNLSERLPASWNKIAGPIWLVRCC